jgi:hypothetical protein
MSESASEEPSWAQKVTAVVADLASVESISWGGQGNWRTQHVIALRDLVLPSTDEPYDLEEGATVHISKSSYPGSLYKLWDNKTVPSANVRVELQPESSSPVEDKAPGASERSREYFYVGTIITAYSYKPLPVTIKKDRTAYLPPEQEEGLSEYVVQDKLGGKYEATVAIASVRICKAGGSVPDHESEPIELMCYELFPYAALHAGLLSAKKFFEALGTGKDSGSEHWAALLGGSLSSKPKLENLKTQEFNRGDIIVFFNRIGAGIHTAIASGQADPDGGGPLVYSLSHNPSSHPGLWPITTITATFADDAVTYAKVVAPAAPV